MTPWAWEATHWEKTTGKGVTQPREGDTRTGRGWEHRYPPRAGAGRGQGAARGAVAQQSLAGGSLGHLGVLAPGAAAAGEERGAGLSSGGALPHVCPPAPVHTWGREPVESCSFCWNRSLSTWFCRSSSKTRFFSLMHSSRRSWPGWGGQPGCLEPPSILPAPSHPPDTHLLVEQCLNHVVGDLGRRGEVWDGAQGTHSLVPQHTRACTHVQHVRVFSCTSSRQRS